MTSDSAKKYLREARQTVQHRLETDGLDAVCGSTVRTLEASRPEWIKCVEAVVGTLDEPETRKGIWAGLLAHLAVAMTMEDMADIEAALRQGAPAS